MGAPKELVKKINKRLLELHKIYPLVCKDWDENFGLVKMTFVESTHSYPHTRSNIRDARWTDFYPIPPTRLA